MLQNTKQGKFVSKNYHPHKTGVYQWAWAGGGLAGRDLGTEQYAHLPPCGTEMSGEPFSGASQTLKKK